MSTLTPNLGLKVPEATDPLETVRSDYAYNLNQLDENGGGGGSGGHTIVNENGTDMPAESKLQFTGGVTVTDDSVNGKTVVDISGGGGNVYGAFIDTNRVLATYNSSGGSAIPSYTALEDCFVAFYVFGKNSQTCRIYVDSVEILTIYFQGDGVQSPTLYLKKGQTLSFSSFDYWSFHYEVYGLTQGTSGIFTPIIYSDTERVVGVWRDNKPLYQKTVYVGSISAGSGVSLAHGIANIDTIANYEGIGFNTVESRWNTLPRVDDDVTYQRGLAVGSSNIVIWGAGNTQAMNNVSVTIWYTKTTDVAGSGNWNTDGVPTVHYSTSEQVIGTWENGKPLYQQTVIFDTGNVASNIDFNISAYMPVNSVVRDSSFTLDFSFNGDTYHGANWGGAYIEINGVSYLSFNIGSAVYNKHVELTIKYTKTTD